MLHLHQIIGTIVRIFAKLLLKHEWVFVQSRIDRLMAFHQLRPDLVPPLVAQRLLVSAEDHRHGCHPGFDLYAICRAVFRRVISGRREGASTIEQQIVRVLTNRFDPTLRRKFREIMLASLVADHFPKSAIPPIYLTVGYYGWQMNNYIQACSRLRFQPNNLSLDEAAAIVARLKYPEPRISPPHRFAQIAQRVEYLKRLYRAHITKGTYEYLGVTKHGPTFQDRRKLKEAIIPTPFA